MTIDLTRILESKRALRRELASRSVAEKLAMLDALRDRLRTIRPVASSEITPKLAGCQTLSDAPNAVSKD